MQSLHFHSTVEERHGTLAQALKLVTQRDRVACKRSHDGHLAGSAGANVGVDGEVAHA